MDGEDYGTVFSNFVFFGLIGWWVIFFCNDTEITRTDTNYRENHP